MSKKFKRGFGRLGCIHQIKKSLHQNFQRLNKQNIKLDLMQGLRELLKPLEVFLVINIKIQMKT